MAHISNNVVLYHIIQIYFGHYDMVGMVIMVFVLYPAYNWLDDFSEKVTKRYFNAGKNAAGKITGTLLAFVILIFVLFLFYLDLWYNKSLLEVLF